MKEIHDDYVSAGAQILTTNTWDANRAKLTKFDWADSLEKINREAVRLAKAAAEGEYVLVAGEVGPLGQLVKPYGPLTKAQVREIFNEQIRILLEEGVDLIRLSTFSSQLEALEAIRAVRSLSAEIPLLALITVLSDGKTSFGDEAEHALNALAADRRRRRRAELHDRPAGSSRRLHARGGRSRPSRSRFCRTPATPGSSPDAPSTPRRRTISGSWPATS